MTSPALQREFHQASWPTEADLVDFVGRAASFSGVELARLAPLLVEPADEAVRRRRLRAFAALCDGVAEPRLFRPLLGVCRNADVEVRQALAPVLVRCCSPAHLKELVALLSDPDPRERRFAGALLRAAGGRSTLGLLAPLLGDPAADRVLLVELALEVGGAAAMPLVAPVLEAGRPAEREAVLRLVSEPDRVGGRSDMALALLAEGLLDPHPGALAAALRGYGRLATEEELLTALKPLLDEASEPERTALAIRELARNSSPRAVSLLDRLAGSGPARVREEAVRALAAVGRPEGLPALERALADHALTVRNAALEGLLEMGRAGRVELRRLVFWLLRSPELDVRRQALEIAAELGDPDDDLWPSMLELLRDEDWWVRERVVEVLVEIGGHKLTPWVAQLLEDESGVLRRHAVEILMRLRDPRALGALLRCAREDEDWWVRERAVEALGEGGDSRVVPHVIKLAASDSELLGAALIALGKLGDDRGLPLVRRGLVHDDPGVRRQALRASASLGGDACLSAVEPLLEDPLYEVRKLAEEIVIGWTGKLEPRSGSISRRLRGLDLLLWQVGESGGDDLLLGAGRKPHLRLGDEVVPMVDLQFSAEQVENSVRPLLSPAQLDALEAGRDVDLSLEVPSAGLRFRTHVFRDRGGWAGVFRRIREELHTLDDLGVPAVAGTWCALSDGLVLVAGPRGSGRSTTLAALVNHVNVHRDAHVVTVEDPIEVVHAGVRSLVTQREVGTHSRDWAFALRSTLRQDADVIVVGELDGPGALEFALSAAETGHLVFAGVAGASASAAIARLVAGFEAEGRARVCARLARSLRAVLAQQLLPRFDGRGSALASEVLLGGDSVADTIRDGQLARLPVLLSAAPPPMVSMDRDLARLVREGTVSADVAWDQAGDKAWFEALLGGDDGAG